MEVYYQYLIALIIFIIVLFALTKIFNLKEKFVALDGLNPLTSYDDYHTFQTDFALDNLPFWDDYNYRMAYRMKDTVYVDDDYGFPLDKDGYIKDSKKYAEIELDATTRTNEDFIHAYKQRWDDDSFFNYRGRKVRQQLIPMNYTDHPEYMPARFDQDHLTLVENPNRSRNNNKFVFQGSNIYF